MTAGEVDIEGQLTTGWDMHSDGSTSAQLRSVPAPGSTHAQHLLGLLGDTLVDEHDVEQHGLSWWYPQVKQWPAIRSVGGSGGGGGASLPLNAEALDFLGGHYWVGERSQDRCSTTELMDEENYRHGFELTVLELDKSVRRALGQQPATPTPRAADPLQPTPAVVIAIEHLVASIDAIVLQPFLYELVRSEASRLIVRARGMMHGSRFTAGRSQCMYCFETESVISDEDRAVCVTPYCRDEAGGRRCWRMVGFDADGQQLPDGQEHRAVRRQWVEVVEPSVRGRGQVTDEQLSRWADVG